MALSRAYWDLVNNLIDRGINTEEKWRLQDKPQYEFYSRIKKRGFLVSEILAEVNSQMVWCKVVYDYAILPYAVDDIRKNRVYELLKVNSYDPQVIGTMFLKWSCNISKRNTIWFSGSRHSMAREMSEALAYIAPSVHVISSYGPKGPFEGIKKAMVYYWNQLQITERHAVVISDVFAGHHVLFSEEHDEIFRSPCVVFSNCNILSIKTDNPHIHAEYMEKLRGCMHRIHLTFHVPLSMGCVSVEDMKRFLTWVSLNQKEVPDRHDLLGATE